MRAWHVPTLSLPLFLLAAVSLAQNTEGKWCLGMSGGLNLWVNDFNQRKIGPGSEIFARYGVSRYVSLGVTAGYEELKARQYPLFAPYDYLKLHSFPASIMTWFHIAPGYRIAPYAYIGAGTMLFKRKDGDGSYIVADEVYSSLQIPLGIGLDAFVASNVAIGLDLGYRVLSDNTDLRTNNLPDTYPTFKLGVHLLLGRSDADDDDHDALSNGLERRVGTDAKNADSDGDGLTDGMEVRRFKTDPLTKDTDGDGLSDGDEVKIYGTNPLDDDTDGDGLTDGDEVSKLMSNPLKCDSDGDGLTNGEEATKYGTDSLLADTDADGLTDWEEVKIYKTNPKGTDSDEDGLSDGDELKWHRTDPLNADTDGGGVKDGAEVSLATNPLDRKDDAALERLGLEAGQRVVLQGVTFLPGSDAVTTSFERILEKVLTELAANPRLSVDIIAYTNDTGGSEDDRRLALRRAEMVKRYLVARGIAEARLDAVGMVHEGPLETSAIGAGISGNNRVEFYVHQ